MYHNPWLHCICDYSHVRSHYPAEAKGCIYGYGKKEGPPPLMAEYIEPDASAWKKQEGGSHYKNLPIQPSEYIVRNGLGWLEGNVVKYVTRHGLKGNSLGDLKKARHYLELLIEEKEKNHAGS